MKKSLLFLLPIALMAISCGGKPEPEIPIYEQGTAKTLKGAGTIFNETLGFNTKDAAVFEENGIRYVFYVSNETAKGEQIIAGRKATKVDGSWKYEEKHIVLRGSSDSWDKKVYNPSVVKGSFKKGTTTYSYLMAYNGNSGDGDTNNSIGFAVTNDLLGEWTKIGNSPVLSNPEIYEASYGFGCPSLISYDGLGKVYMFYSVGETLISHGAVTSFDLSNLDNIKQGGFSIIPVTGLNDGQDLNVYTNAGFALSMDKNTLYMVKDRLPQSSNAPGSTQSITIAKTSMSLLGSHTLSWQIVKTIEQEDTIDETQAESFGWDEIYSGEFVTDPSGKLLSNSSLEVIYSTFCESGEDVSYSSTLASFGVTL